MDNRNYTILVAEDEEDLLEVCFDVLELEGFKVLSAKNGKEALEIFLSQDVDFILSDSHMPLIDGLELLKKMKESDKALPPFYLVTGDISLTEAELRSRGALGLIPKPFDLNEVLNLILTTLSK